MVAAAPGPINSGGSFVPAVLQRTVSVSTVSTIQTLADKSSVGCQHAAISAPDVIVELLHSLSKSSSLDV